MTAPLSKVTPLKMKETAASKVRPVYGGLSPRRRLLNRSFDGGSEHDDGEGTWIFSYADMITILMMFFILLLSISSLDVEKFEKLKGAISKTNQKQTPPKSSTETVQPDNSQNQTPAAEIDVFKNRDISDFKIASIPLHVLAEKVSQLPTEDNNTQVLTAVETLMSAVNYSKIEKNSKQEKEFSEMMKKVSALAKSVRDSDALEEKKKQEIKVSLAAKSLFTSQGRVTNEGKEVLMKLAAAIRQLDPFPQIVISSFVSASEELDAAKAVQLSNIRASQVFSVFVEQRLLSSLIAMAGYGRSKALLSEKDQYGNQTPGGENANSRIEISIRRRRDARP
jgi:flagellar motor protein MotB